MILSTFVDKSLELRKSLTWTRWSSKKWHFMLKSDARETEQKLTFWTKMSFLAKFLNHVFKTSKKTLSYSRIYCKIYKIENIGKIGQTRSSMQAKRVIYYGSTRSTLSTPSRQKWVPHFCRWIYKSWKKVKLSLSRLFLAKKPKSAFLSTFVNFKGKKWGLKNSTL